MKLSHIFPVSHLKNVNSFQFMDKTSLDNSFCLKLHRMMPRYFIPPDWDLKFDIKGLVADLQKACIHPRGNFQIDT